MSGGSGISSSKEQRPVTDGFNGGESGRTTFFTSQGFSSVGSSGCHGARTNINSPSPSVGSRPCQKIWWPMAKINTQSAEKQEAWWGVGRQHCRGGLHDLSRAKYNTHPLVYPCHTVTTTLPTTPPTVVYKCCGRLKLWHKPNLKLHLKFQSKTCRGYPRSIQTYMFTQGQSFWNPD